MKTLPITTPKEEIPVTGYSIVTGAPDGNFYVRDNAAETILCKCSKLEHAERIALALFRENLYLTADTP